MTTLTTQAATTATRAGTRRTRLAWMVGLCALLVAAAALAYRGLPGLLGPPGGAPVLSYFTVEPRSFSVVLKEKGELKAARSQEIKCEVEGRSTILSLVPEGKAVEKGDLLVELASDQIEDRIRQEELKETNAVAALRAAETELSIQLDRNKSDIRKAELEITLARLALEKYKSGDWVQTLREHEINIEQAQITLRRAREDFEASKELYEKKFITRAEYDEDEFKLQRSEWELQKAELARELLEKYTHTADSARLESDLQEAEKEHDRVVKSAQAEELRKQAALEARRKELELIQDQLRKLRQQHEKCRILAPSDGFVVYYQESSRWGDSGDVVKEGGQVVERQTIMILPDTSRMVVTVRIHEAKTDRIRLGQPVMVEVEGMPGQRFTGVVSKIAVVADTQNRWLNPELKEYETEILLDPTEFALKPGTTAHAEILVDRRENVLAVPIQAIVSKGRNRYVFRRSGAQLLPAEVQIGAVSTEWTEIASGLSAGEQVLLAIDDSHIRLLPDAPAPPEGQSFPENMMNGMPPVERSPSRERPPRSGTAETRPRPPGAGGARAGTGGGATGAAPAAGTGTGTAAPPTGSSTHP